MMNKREIRRLMRKKRRMACLIIILICFMAYHSLKASKIEACTPNKFVTVVVNEGDSLWKIADRFSTKETDIRNYINHIQEVNTLNNSVLQPGDILLVPVWHDN